MANGEEPGIGWGFDDLQFRRMPDTPDPRSFDCGSPEQNRYLFERAMRDQRELVSSTTLVWVKGMLAAYVTLCMDSLDLGDAQPEEIPYPSLPALKLAQMGVNERFQGVGLGTALLGYVVFRAQEIGREIGCRYVTLDARTEDLADFYSGQGFVRNELAEPADTISMRFDIRERGRLPGSRGIL